MGAGGEITMKRKRLFATLLSVVIALSGVAGFLPSELVLAEGGPEPDLFFSEYGHGKKINGVTGTSGNNKYLELYNPSSHPINIEDYEIFISFNGGNSTSTIKLKPNYPENSPGPSTVEPGGVYVICKNHVEVSLDILEHANQRHSRIDFTGDDAIVLRKTEVSSEGSNLVVVDRIGQVGFHPSTNWMDNATYVRLPNVEEGDPNYNQPFSVADEWVKKSVNDFDDLGKHKMDRHYVSFHEGDGSFINDPPRSEWVLDGDSANPPDSIHVNPPSGKVFVGWDKSYTNITGPIALTAQFADPPRDIFFSEYVEGTSYNKALELYNPTDQAINLGTDQVKIEFYQNGATSPVRTIALSGLIAPGGTFVLVNKDANDTLKSLANFVDLGNVDHWFNGDDTIVLKRKGEIVDVFGQVGFQPSGGGWTLNGVKTADQTLLRKPFVQIGDSNRNDTFDPALEWYPIGKDNFQDLGYHALKACQVNFTPGSYGVISSGNAVQYVYRRLKNAVQEPQVAPIEGYTHLGWAPGMNVLNGGVTQDMTVTALYVPIVYTVTFHAGELGVFPGGASSSAFQVRHGGSIDPPSVVANEGVHHVGWTLNPSEASFSNVKMNFVATALYEYIEYEVKFNLDGKGNLDAGEAPERLHQWVRHKEEADSPQVLPERQQIFIGWDQDFRRVTGDLNVTAQYISWAPPDLFFSEYIEGTSNNKALEIFNPTSQDIDLAAGDYKVGMYFNYGDGGNAAYTHTLLIPLTGTIRAHKTYVLKHSEASLIPYPGDQTNGAGWFNGNDRVVLMRGTDIIDEIGKFGENPDPNQKDNDDIEGWKMGNVQTGNRTLVRKAWVCRGAIHDDLPFYDPSAQWTVYDVNTFDHLGSHLCSVIHKVTFHPNGGEVESGHLVQSVYSGDDAIAPSLKAPEGYSFDGWDKPFTSVQDDLDLTAQWEAIEYEITYELDGGMNDSDNPDHYTIESEDIQLKEASKSGYSFAGWFSAVSGGEKITVIPKGSTGKLTLYARYTANKYRVSFDAQGGHSVHPIEVTYDESYGDLPESTRTGHSFLAWYDAPIGGSPVTKESIVKVTSDHTLYARWALNQYTISFDPAGGSDVESMTQGYGTSLISPPSPSRLGYSFDGWDKDFPSTMPAENLTFTARWSLIEYDIVYELDGGENHPDNPGKFSIESEDLFLKPASKTGYRFTGWFSAPEGGLPVDRIPGGAHGDRTLYARWEPISYRITYLLYGGSNPAANPGHYTIETPDIELKAPYKTGYGFLGWYMNRNGGERVDRIVQGTSGDLTLSALFGANQYAVSFDSQGAGVLDKIRVTFDLPYGPLPQPDKEGHRFLGWFDAPSGGMEIRSSDPVQRVGDHILYARWEVKSYTIRFDTGGGDEISSQTLPFRGTISRPPDPSRPCCRFIGWDPEIPRTMPAHDLTVRALWEVKSFTLVFDSAGGSPVLPMSQEFGTPITPPPDPTREGHRFLGWEPELPETMPPEGIVLQARWEVNQYRIHFDSAGGSPLAPQVFDYGSPIELLRQPYRQDHRFLGWEPELPDTMPARDLTLTALWEKILDEREPGDVPVTGQAMPWSPAILFLALGLLALVLSRRRRQGGEG